MRAHVVPSSFRYLHVNCHSVPQKSQLGLPPSGCPSLDIKTRESFLAELSERGKDFGSVFMFMAWLRDKAEQGEESGEDQPCGESAQGEVEGGREGGAVHSLMK
jgi:hypothetical protein